MQECFFRSLLDGSSQLTQTYFTNDLRNHKNTLTDAQKIQLIAAYEKKRYLTVNEVALVLGIHPRSVTRQIAKGQIECEYNTSRKVKVIDIRKLPKKNSQD